MLEIGAGRREMAYQTGERTKDRGRRSEGVRKSRDLENRKQKLPKSNAEILKS